MSTSSESTSIEVIQGDRSNNASSSSSLAADSKRGKLSFKTKLCYSLGHVYNDMAVSIWFSFTLVFFEHRLPGVWSAALLMLGQVADATCSPLVGYASDRFAHTWVFRKLGRRKTLHALGFVLSLLSLPPLYNRCFLGDDQPRAILFVYYGVLAFVFQGSWAASQVRNRFFLVLKFHYVAYLSMHLQSIFRSLTWHSSMT